MAGMQVRILLVAVLAGVLTCTCVQRYSTLDPVSIAGQYSNANQIVFRLNKTRDLPTPLGFRDLYGRRIDEGVIEVIYKGMPTKDTIALEVRETSIESKDNTFWNTLNVKPRQKTLPETRRKISVKYRKQFVITIADTAVQLTEVSPDHIRYVIHTKNYEPALAPPPRIMEAHSTQALTPPVPNVNSIRGDLTDPS